jgi:beta-glucanase (GH16 family)
VADIDPVTGAVTYKPFFDSFDNGTVNFPDTWNVDTSVPGQVTLHAPEYWLNSGMMEETGTRAHGHGYGTYTVNAMMTGAMPGPAIMLWMGDNKSWPGPEIDFGEIAGDGSGQYSSLHWAENGEDRYDIRWYDQGVTMGEFHTYELLWEPGRITIEVDDRTQAVYTEHVPQDYAHGGMDQVFAFLNLRPETSLTVLDASYVPLESLYGPQPALPAADVAPAPAPAPAEEWVDWNAIAAQATANWQATGVWFV